MYDSPHQFLPVQPADSLLAPLRERASAVVNDAAGLAAQAHPATKLALRELLRSMNSYYSNRIEGQSTTPRNIRQPRHFLIYRIENDMVVIGRVLHDVMNLAQHLDSRRAWF